jgi:hypothetical protein
MGDAENMCFAVSQQSFSVTNSIPKSSCADEIGPHSEQHSTKLINAAAFD